MVEIPRILLMMCVAHYCVKQPKNFVGVLLGVQGVALGVFLCLPGA